MNIFKSLNEVILYLENNLENKIDYNKVARILGTNLYTAEQLFKLTTGVTMKEYVRFRRLTLAAKDLRENKKIIYVANKYGYSNHSSFTRSFLNFHNATPIEVKNGAKSNSFPIVHFDNMAPDIKNISYKIISKKRFILYTKKGKFPLVNNSNSIETFWQQIKKENVSISSSNKKYGVSEHLPNNNKDFYYHIGLESEWTNSDKISIYSNKWFVITAPSINAIDIHKSIRDAENTYIPSLNYSLEDKDYIEIYYDNNVELWFPII